MKGLFSFSQTKALNFIISAFFAYRFVFKQIFFLPKLIPTFFATAILISFFVIPACYSEEIFHIGFSTNTLGDVNRNDAMAAVKVWTHSLAADNKIPVDPQPIIFEDIDTIRQAITQKHVDCINVTTPEFVKLMAMVDLDNLVAGIKADSSTEEYILVTKKSHGHKSLSDLQGKSLLQLTTSRTSLAEIWLDTELMSSSYPPAKKHFSTIIRSDNLNEAVLNVFFDKLDACLITRSGFETMAELNPQLSRQLNIIKQSPPYIPMLFAFRKDYHPPFKGYILDQLDNWHKEPGGRQILTIFHTDSIVRIGYEQLISSIELIEFHEKLMSDDNHNEQTL